jgi:lysophospholipase L1-like esterase
MLNRKSVLDLLFVAAITLGGSTAQAADAATPAAAQSAVSQPKLGDADYPAPAGYDNPTRHASKMNAIKNNNYDLVLIGDSLTECLEAGGEWKPLKAVWKKYYTPRNALNLGYSGYRTENILRNLLEGELDFKKSPKVFVLLIGSNNTDDQHYGQIHTGEQVFSGIKAIVTLIRQRHPTSKIIIRRPFPCGAKGDVTAYARKYNRSPEAKAELEKSGQLASTLADNKHIFYSDVYQALLRPDGTINTDLMPDLIHVNAAGAAVAAEGLEPLLVKLMGPRPVLPPPPVSLAFGKPAVASDTNPSYPEKDALDGNEDTCWSTMEDCPSAWLEVDLGTPTEVGRVVMLESLPVAATYTIEAQLPDGFWKELASGGRIGDCGIGEETTFTPFKARKFRVTMAKNGGYRLNLAELGLYVK